MRGYDLFVLCKVDLVWTRELLRAARKGNLRYFESRVCAGWAAHVRAVDEKVGLQNYADVTGKEYVESTADEAEEETEL